MQIMPHPTGSLKGALSVLGASIAQRSDAGVSLRACPTYGWVAFKGQKAKEGLHHLGALSAPSQAEEEGGLGEGGEYDNYQ